MVKTDVFTILKLIHQVLIGISSLARKTHLQDRNRSVPGLIFLFWNVDRRPQKQIIVIMITLRWNHITKNLREFSKPKLFWEFTGNCDFLTWHWLVEYNLNSLVEHIICWYHLLNIRIFWGQETWLFKSNQPILS